ncbi:MAG: hypothetical protein JSR97_01775 [Verrucomicrobia bacterium]|nr:hypothetical protein [Verrucomicrobiota bacterium]
MSFSYFLIETVMVNALHAESCVVYNGTEFYLRENPRVSCWSANGDIVKIYRHCIGCGVNRFNTNVWRALPNGWNPEFAKAVPRVISPLFCHDCQTNTEKVRSAWRLPWSER